MIIRIIIVTLLLSFAVLASADPLFREADLGTLFTTQKQRKHIDQLRRGSATGALAKKHVMPSHIKVNGIVKSSNGGSIVWVNGKNDKRITRDGIKVLPGSSTTGSVVMLVDGKMIKVRPGESWSDNKEER